VNYQDAQDVSRAVAELFPAIYRQAHQRQALADVPARMLAAMQHLYLNGPLTVGEQAEHHGVSRPTMTELIDRLEERHFVSRMADDRDRRRVFVWLTDSGLHHAETSLQVLDTEVLGQAVKHLTVTQRRHLVLGMQALVASLEGVE
jgi:DNA-binding MarR family transcriptional regulator